MTFAIGVLVGLVVAILVIYLIAIVCLTLFSLRSLRIYQYLTPAQVGVQQEEVSYMTADGIQIGGWYVPGRGDLTVLFVHGYMANRCEFVHFAPKLLAKGVGQMYIDTRCHGRSGGTYVGLGHAERHEVLGAIDYIKRREPGAKIMLVGSSMGGAACIFAAEHRRDDVVAILADSTYIAMERAVTGWWTFLAHRNKGWQAKVLAGMAVVLLAPVSWLGERIAGFRVKQVRTDTVLAKLHGLEFVAIVGDRDPIVNPAETALMVQAAGPNARYEVFEGSTHGQPRGHEPERYWRILEAMVDSKKS